MDKPPASIRLDFTETPARSTTALVRDGCGRDVTDNVRRDGTSLQIQVGPARPGQWTVVVAVLSDEDGHAKETRLDFTVRGVPDQPGVAYRILGDVAKANINVDMIVQNTGADGTTDFTFTVHRGDYAKALDVLRAAKLAAREISGDDKIVKISVVGVGMRSHSGIASTMFKALADEGINIQMISTSEIKISVVVDEKYLELGVRALHTAFGLEKPTNRDTVKGAASVKM